MAVPLTSYLSSNSRYEGFDVVSAGVTWCERHITTRFPNFHFQTINAFNERYRPDGSADSQAYRFPYDDKSFDFVFATSVFTHLLPEVTIAYLREVSRVLRPGGRMFSTFFLTNSRKMIASGAKPMLSFGHDGAGYRSVTRRTPEVAVGYDEADVLSMINDAAMSVVDIHYGTWSGDGGLTFQDILIAQRTG